ncbi:MAG TPA: conjugal transfer protein [Streptosporangiaceae bacterium]
MVRRALLDRGDELAVDPEAHFRGQAPSDSRARSRGQAHYDSRPLSAGRAGSRWRGAGGRWLVWVGRVVVWAVIVLIGYRGVLAIVSEPSSSGRPASPVTTPGARSSFPVALAEAYALEFGTVYLNFSPATAASRSTALAAFLPAGTDPQLGWNGAGTQQLLDEQVAGITVRTAHTAVVTLLARLSSGSTIELGVPVYAAGGSMAVSGDPALLPGPATAVVPAAAQAAADQATEATLQSQLAGFFAAYASGDQATLARFITPGTHLTGLGGEVTLGAVDAVNAPVGGSTRIVSVTVTWQFPVRPAGRRVATGSASAALQMTYELTVVRRAGTWDVQSISASAQPAAQGPP